MTANWPFGDLRPLTYDFIMADPATRFETWSPKGEAKAPQTHYRNTMSVDEICALPVNELARGDAVLFLWCTWPMLLEQRHPSRSPPGRMMESWGFTYASGGAWHKRTRHGKTAFGTGYRLRSACEPFLIGTVGKPRTSRSHRNLIEGLAREHSRKPEDAYLWAETYVPALRFVELFSCTNRPGWDAWGDETGKFDPPEIIP